MNLSNYAAERAQAHTTIPGYQVEALPVEEIEATYPGGLSAEEYAALEAPNFTDEESEELDSFTASTNTYTDGFNPFELHCGAGARAFNNQFSD